MKKILIILFLILILGLGGGAFFVKSKSQVAPKPKPTTAAASKIIVTYSFVKANQLPVVVAQEKGFFKKYNLDVKINQVNKNVAQVITSGKADVTLGTPNISLTAAVQGAGLSWVGSINNDQALVVVSTKPVVSIRSAGVITGPAKAQTIGLLELLGANTKNIVFQDVADNPTRLLALKEKQVDVIHAPKTDWLIFQKKNNLSSDEYKILLDSSTNKRFQLPIGIIVRNDYLSKNKITVENFAKALIEADFWIKNNKLEFIKTLGKRYSDTPKEDITIEAESYISTLKNLEFTPTPEKGNQMLKLVESVNPKAKDYNLNNFINTGVSDSLKQSGFIEKFNFK